MIALVFGVAGRIGSGKTTIARYLSQMYSFQRLSYSDMLTDLYRVQNASSVQPTRHDLQEFGTRLTNVVGNAGLTVLLLRERKAARLVIDGIRHFNSYNFLLETYGPQFRLIYREATINLRYRLHNARIGPSNAISFVDFQIMDTHPAETDVDNLKEYADSLLPYFEDTAQLYQAIDQFMSAI